MHRRQALITLLAPALLNAKPGAFQGEKALEFTRAIAAFGPRPSGSPALSRARAYIVKTLRQWKCETAEDPFTAATPAGKIAMANIIARIPGSSGKAVAVSGHYDTKRLPGTFVGANDGGASAGFLLELARATAGRPRRDDLYIVFFDGEEAVRDWTDKDSLYGSRHLAGKWYREGMLAKLKALINVDMIGDRDLGILKEMYSSGSLMRLIWSVARELGHSQHFLTAEGAVADDHFPFLSKGITAANLIDFEYGPNNQHWHTSQDTVDKLSAQSFQVVGDVVLETLKRLEAW